MVNTSPRSRRLILKQFLAKSTIDGLKSISDAHSLCALLFWSLAFLLCLSLMFYFCVWNIIEYSEYKTVTDLRFLSDYRSKFPALTICNTGVFRDDRLHRPLIDYLYNRSLIPSNNYSQTIPPELLFEITAFLLTLVNTAGVQQKKLFELTFSLDTMLMSCIFNGQNCTQSDFVWFYSYEYGSCYTFNAQSINDTTSSLRMTTENGGEGELDLQLYIQSQLYYGFFLGTSGLVTLIHDNQQLPQIEQQGLQLEPNHKHILQYTKSEINYLGSPYTPCTTEMRPDMSALFQKYGAKYQYSQQVCYTLCEQAFIYVQCNCTDFDIWNYNIVYLDNKVITTPLCAYLSSCVQQAKTTFNLNEAVQNQYCSHCLQECAVVNYDIVSSSLKTPTIWSYPMIKGQVEQQFQNITLPADWSTNYKTYIDQSYLAVQVTKSTYNVKSYEQQPSKTTDQLISDLGGQTVLWIGFSLIAILEILELIYLLIYRSCTKVHQQNITVRPAVEVAVLNPTGTSFKVNGGLQNTAIIDEIVLVK